MKSHLSLSNKEEYAKLKVKEQRMTELRNAFTNDQLKSHWYTYEMLSDRYDDMI